MNNKAEKMEIEALSPSHIKKLGHPLKEIRERALHLLVAKLKLGWKIENELGTTREILELLLAWFHVEKPTLQREALLLLLNIIKTNAGNYVIKEYGIKELISNLYSFKCKIEPNAEELFKDIIDTLRCFGPNKSEVNTTIPELNLQSISGSSLDKEVSTEIKNFNQQLLISKGSNMFNDCDTSQETIELQDGISLLLFPWVQMHPSDVKTLHLVEDTFRSLKSTQRCCRFVCDVFLHDFPPEIFLNRPSIIQSLLTIISDASLLQVYEALYVLMCITKALAMRLHQLLCPDLAHLNKFTDNVRSYVDKDTYQEALKHLAEDSCYRQSELLDDVDPVLKQLPVPIYVLDTLHTLLSTMIRNVILEEPFKKEDFIEMMELSMSVLIVENLINLLLDCVSDEFWKFEHSSKTQRDIAHKSCMAMRLLADLLNKYKRSFTKDNSRWRHRVAWLRLVFCAQRLISWAHQSLLPSTLVLALQVAQIDPALDILYPKVAQNIVDVLQIPNVSVDQEFSKKYREFCQLTASMEHAVQFMKNISFCSSKNILVIIQQSLPVLEVHQCESYVQDIGEILFTVLKKWSMDDTDWSVARAITLRLMAHNCSWVQIIFYKTMCESVNEIFCDNNEQELEKEKDLYLLCDVGILTELCCQGLSSPIKQVADSANDIMLYLLRGRLLLSESCWWRLLASVLPILPLLHCYAAHETSLGQAICKSLEVDIADCMGIPRSEVIWGLVRLLYVKCPMVQMDAALHLCQLLDDEKYLPQKELLRSDVLVNALRGVKTHNFNVDTESSSPKLPQVNSIIQIMDVLKQDIIIDENAVGFMEHFHRSHPVLQPSVRLSTLQQLSVLMRDPYSHETFIKHDGLQITISILRMALSVDDFLAFPDCALSCISILNSVCYNDRHSLAKIADLPLLLLRAILIFPSKDSLVEMASQVLSVTAWAGFALQELDRQRKRVVALPKCVSENTTLPFPVQSYWSSSPNAVHSCLEWLLSEECWRSALRVRWACAWNGAAQILRDISSSPISSPPPGPLSLRVTPDDLTALQSACPLRATARALMILQNATSHTQVTETIAILEGYMYLIKMSSIPLEEFAALPWTKTMARFLIAAPASPRDVTLLISILKFILHYAHNVSEEKMLMKWIITSFIESDDGIITLLSRRQLFPQQTEQEDIEIIQLHKHIVKVLLRCVIILDRDDNFEVAKIESLFKILLCCLEKINLKDFHMLGYLNEVVRCLRYIANSRHCRPGESLIIQSLSQLNKVVAKCGVGDAGYKGQACRLDAMLTMLALVRRAHDENIPVQHWSECWSEATVRAVCACCCAGRPELRAAALHLLATLAHYTQLLPHLQQAVPGNSLCKYAVRIFSETSEANVVRAAAAALLSALCTRSSTYTNDLHKNPSSVRFYVPKGVTMPNKATGFLVPEIS